MPCRNDFDERSYSSTTVDALRAHYEGLLHNAAVELDELRELVIAIWDDNASDMGTDEVLLDKVNNVKKRQIQHRKDDLSRLLMHFAKCGDFDMANKIAKVDSNEPLQPQLGFNPDDY